MQAKDVQSAVARLGLEQASTCAALQSYAIPVLRELHARASGWKFWIKAGLGLAIGALEGYVALRCGRAASPSI